MEWPEKNGDIVLRYTQEIQKAILLQFFNRARGKGFPKNVKFFVHLQNLESVKNAKIVFLSSIKEEDVILVNYAEKELSGIESLPQTLIF